MKCDIVIPIWNQLELTKSCIQYIIKNTHYPYRLILIDNGSDMDTKSYLERLKDSKKMEVTLIRNKENLGFVKAINQGIRLSKAPYICIMNNDTLATDGWLTELVEVANLDVNIGLVNPSSNNLGQNPGSLSIDKYAETLKKFKGQFIEMGACLGFCMLMKRKIFQRLGLFDEIYEIGNFEDTEYSRKAESLGLVCVRAKGAYVYHRISRSFLKKANFEELFRRNQEIFYKRWGKPRRLLYIMTKDHRKLYDWISAESIKRARFGNWIWLFLKRKTPFQVKEHSNIKIFYLPDFLFKQNCIFRILKRKKKFDSIYVDETEFLEKLSGLKRFHNADVMLMGG